MPLIRIDAVAGRAQEEISTLLEAAHRAIVSALGVPQSDRYQIYQEHPAGHLVIEDTGLGIKRRSNLLVISVTTRPRSQEKKTELYQELVRELQSTCGIAPSDIIVSIVSNTPADWSFGNGEAQYLNGKL